MLHLVITRGRNTGNIFVYAVNTDMNPVVALKEHQSILCSEEIIDVAEIPVEGSWEVVAIIEPDEIGDDDSGE